MVRNGEFYLVDLDIRVGERCRAPKLEIDLGGSKQVFDVKYGDNDLQFLVRANKNGYMRIPIVRAEGLSCAGSSIKPKISFKSLSYTKL